MRTEREIIMRLERVKGYQNTNVNRAFLEINENQIDRESAIRHFAATDAEILALKWMLEEPGLFAYEETNPF